MPEALLDVLADPQPVGQRRTSLLEQPRDNPAFDATFSLSPKPIGEQQVETPPLEQWV